MKTQTYYTKEEMISKLEELVLGQILDYAYDADGTDDPAAYVHAMDKILGAADLLDIFREKMESEEDDDD